MKDDFEPPETNPLKLKFPHEKVLLKKVPEKP